MKGPSSAAMRLRKMTLSKLRITIAAPSFYTARERFDGACQKVVVDWIFEAAFCSVRGHAVEVNGFVKAAQKAAFEAACGEEKKRFEMWQKQRVAIGKSEGSFKAWDDELAEHEHDGDCEDGESQAAGKGGVALGEAAGDTVTEGKVVGLEMFKPGTVEIMEARPVCLCKVLCTEEDWTAEG
jgi:hypothetical protein